ncbi:MAG TPA: replicative DNA helicase [Herpetosiphonaceae bacterium]
MEKSLPYNETAERATLGAILLDREAVVPIAAWLQPEHFYIEKHAWVYEAQLNCYNRRTPPDLTTVADELRRTERLEQIGGVPFLIDLSNAVPTAFHVEYYAKIVERTAVLRRLIRAGGKIAALGYDETDDVEQTLDAAEQELFNVSQRRGLQGFVPLAQVVDQYYEYLSEVQERGPEMVGLPTGFIDFDRMTGGLHKSDLLILAARPGVGKSSLAMSIAFNMAMQHRTPVGVFALEMGRDQLLQRLLATHTGIDSQKLRTGRISTNELTVLMDAMGQLSAAPIYIDDTPGVTVTEVRSKARRLQAEHGLEVLIIDYLQLMSGSSKRNDNRVQEVSEISRSLKALARELNIPVMALSQLSRAVEGRTSHVPVLADLRESGCLTGDTLIYMPETGAYRRIDQLVGQTNFKVLALNTETWKLEPHPVTNAFATGRKPVYRLTTGLGRTIRATANHKFLTIQGWKRLDELDVGTRLALPRQLPGTTQATMSDAELALLGHLIGDGCTLPRHIIQYTTNDITLAETVVDLATQVFGEAVTPRISQERDWFQVYLVAAARLTHNVCNPVAAWMDSLNVFGLRSHEKCVPEQVFAQPDAGIACFLRHLWATDGCIWMASRSHSQPTIYYATSSLRLAQDVQSLLLRLSINATLHRVAQKGKGRDQFHVNVDGRHEIVRFLQRIGAVGQSKIAHRAAILDYLEQRPANTNRDVIPREVWRQIVIPAMQTVAMTGRQMQAGLGNAYCGTSLYKQNLSRARVARLAHVVQSESLTNLAQSDVYWDHIIAIEPDGEEEVYDLTVDGLHNFVANNIVVHNSIEQDADIVMFIYREEMYDKDTDKKGIAEVHIAKHRNGPLGVVPLFFDQRTTRFQNLAPFQSPDGY